MNGRGISAAAAKVVYRLLVEHHKKGLIDVLGEPLSVEQIVEEHDLWLEDEWTHVGHIVLVCLENEKLVEQYKKGNPKMIDVLVGKTLKAANMKLDASVVRELLPLIIERHWP